MTYIEFEKELRDNNINEEDLPKLLVSLLLKKGQKVATAESCTGGLISKMITDVNGASSVFDCGVCSYANNIKEKLLGVDAETLRQKGAVSREVAAQMAKGVLALSGADIAVSVTGIAGPTGGSEQKPVGTVYIGIATMAKNYVILADFAENNWIRDKIRQHSANLAIYCVIKEICSL